MNCIFIDCGKDCYANKTTLENYILSLCESGYKNFSIYNDYQIYKSKDISMQTPYIDPNFDKIDTCTDTICKMLISAQQHFDNIEIVIYNDKNLMDNIENYVQKSNLFFCLSAKTTKLLQSKYKNKTFININNVSYNITL